MTLSPLAASHPPIAFRAMLPLAALLGLAACSASDATPAPPGSTASVVARQLAVGAFHSCVVSEAGEVWCWGDNSMGELGDGTVAARSGPVRAAIAESVTQVDIGGGHTCALTDAGRVYCFGENNEGQLGDGTTANRTMPTQVLGLNDVVDISAGTEFTCALGSQGEVWCWGANNLAQLGAGAGAANRPTAGRASLGQSHVTGIEAGALSACAFADDGSAYCWGVAPPGQDAGAYPTPARIGALDGAQEVAMGANFWCARGQGGAVGCWGGNAEGQLGNGTTTGSDTPTDVLLPGPADSISIGRAGVELMGLVYDAFACAALTDGLAACWGVNGAGQLGDGTTESRAQPVLVQGLQDVTRVEAGAVDLMAPTESHACALTQNGEAWCWGRNGLGELGDGTTTPSSVPVRVDLPYPD